MASRSKALHKMGEIGAAFHPRKLVAIVELFMTKSDHGFFRGKVQIGKKSNFKCGSSNLSKSTKRKQPIFGEDSKKKTVNENARYFQLLKRAITKGLCS